MTYPEDVQKALDYAADAGWTRERYQAILALALHHLDKPERPEIHVMLAEGDTPFAVEAFKEGAYREVMGTILAGHVYFACPVCARRTVPTFAQDAWETASVDCEESEDGGVEAYRDSWGSEGSGDGGWFTCGNRGCYAELSIPEWLDFAT